MLSQDNTRVVQSDTLNKKTHTDVGYRLPNPPEYKNEPTYTRDNPRVSVRSTKNVPGPIMGVQYYNAHVNNNEHNNDMHSLYVQADMSVHEIEDVPLTYAQAISSPDAKSWKQAINSELTSLRQNNTFKLTTLPPGALKVKHKWIFKKKINADGSIRFKARVVACGYSQQYGITYFNTYSPTLALSSLRLLLSICSKHKFQIHHLDITTAFLYGDMKCDVYMDVPDGYKPHTHAEKQFLQEQPNHLCSPQRTGPRTRPAQIVVKLNRTLYGCKQAAWAWNQKLSTFLHSIGFTQLKSDTCIYIHTRNNRRIILTTYVDDILVAYKHPNDLQWVIENIRKHFKFKNLGKLKYCLGLEITCSSSLQYSLSQTGYITRMAEKYNIRPSKTPRVPLPASANLEDVTSPTVDQTKYRSLIGAIIYVSVASRADICYAVSRLSQYANNPRVIHMQAAEKLLKYLVNTCDYTITYNNNIECPTLVAYSDASFGTCPKTLKSVSGWITLYYGGLITWKSQRQKVTAMSSAEAEYMAMSSCARDIIYINNILGELGYLDANVPAYLYTDSATAIQISEKAGLSKRSKSIRLAYHNVRACVADGTISLRFIPGKHNPADALTKPVSRDMLNRHTDKCYSK